LVSIVPYGWDTSFAQEFFDTERFWDFADDPSLVAMFRPGDIQRVQVILRASFMKTAATKIDATTWKELIERVAALAIECNLRTETL
jgi:hypothetical protein